MPGILTDTAETVLKRRYYLKDEEGNCIEDWNLLSGRVAKYVANGNKTLEDKFFWMINELYFLPNSPCLSNCNTELGNLSACFVLPVEDSMEGIFDAIKWGALVHKQSGGTGYSFSRLRSKNSAVKSTQGVASGPVSFAEVFDSATNTIKQGGKRRGANMGSLRVDHGDIEDFITIKSDPNKLNNFNLSVAITDEFMTAVKAGEAEESRIFDLIIDRAHASGEPGIIYIDTANKSNNLRYLGDYETTNPCGEQFLLPFNSCSLGSINWHKFVINGVVDWGLLEKVVRLATRFLDMTLDVNKFPLPQITEATLKTRNIGLGPMGIHDTLIALELPYDSQEGRDKVAEIMNFVHQCANDESIKMAEESGAYPAYLPDTSAPYRKNANLTTCAPTGTISMIADCSSGCEPLFSLVMVKRVLDNDLLILTDKQFEKVARREGFFSEELMKKIADTGTVKHHEVPVKWQEIFKTAKDISPDNHIRMQATVQNNGNDSGTSKTVNLPANATKQDVRDAFMLAYDLGCKGVTVYVDQCRANQVLNTVGNLDKPTATVSADGPVKQDLPDTLRARRYKLKLDDGENVYIIICFSEDGKPMEVFAKFPYDGRHEYREKSTAYTTVCRLVSLALRYSIPVEEVIKQLDKSSGSMMDLPAQLTKLLKTFLSETNSPYTVPCPECGEPTLVFEEGCQVCKSCGFSKCS